MRRRTWICSHWKTGLQLLNVARAVTGPHWRLAGWNVVIDIIQHATRAFGPDNGLVASSGSTLRQPFKSPRWYYCGKDLRYRVSSRQSTVIVPSHALKEATLHPPDYRHSLSLGPPHWGDFDAQGCPAVRALSAFEDRSKHTNAKQED